MRADYFRSTPDITSRVMRWFWIIIAIVIFVAIIMMAQTRIKENPVAVDIDRQVADAQAAIPTPTHTDATAPARSPAASVATRTTIDTQTPTAAEPAGVVRVDARTLQLDGRFDVSGTGSTSDPYRVTWPLMMSAHNDAAPAGQVILPKYISILDGTSIEISGYLAPPVATDFTSELLVMRNRWDGCCIGTPPTPFDCIEVRLEKSVAVRGKHLIQYGTIRGTLRIEPFAAGKFLLGLYRIEHGEVEGFGG